MFVCPFATDRKMPEIWVAIFFPKVQDMKAHYFDRKYKILQ